mmetsp:Transcript_23089/g.54873  ORF Transcript_23089/g.54873 Transcript_23089/m.54873 type:complete len:510 (-) Transcript_23089:507-2036(-)
MARQSPSGVYPRRARSCLHVFKFKDVAILCLALPFLTLSASRSFVPAQPDMLASPARSQPSAAQGGALSAGKIPATASKQATSGEEQEEGSEDSTVLAEDPATIRRLFARAAKPNFAYAKNKTSAYEILPHPEEEEQDQRSASTPESRLRRKMRKLAERMRPVEEEYPDQEHERQRKRFVRKAATQIMNLAAAKKHKDQQAAIASADKKALSGPEGLKALGYKGNDKFKPESVGLEGAVPVKKGKKRSPTDEAIKRFGELLRDKEAVRKMTKNNADKSKNLLRLVHRTNKRWARRFERDGDSAVMGRSQATEGGEEGAATQLKSKALRLKGGGGPLRLRGGGEMEGISVYLPTSYPSILHWALAMVKIILRIVLSKFGIKIFADPPKPATTESAKGKSSTPKSSKKKAKVAPMPASAVAALEGATFRHSGWLGGQRLRRRPRHATFRHRVCYLHEQRAHLLEGKTPGVRHLELGGGGVRRGEPVRTGGPVSSAPPRPLRLPSVRSYCSV